MRPVVLSIAGSDSSGGAGVQADVVTLTRLGVHAATVVTAVTAQRTGGVDRIHIVPDEVIEAQLTSVLGDLPVAVVKTGMLPTAGAVRAVAAALAVRGLPLVVDPVLVASSGDRLTDDEVAAAVRAELLPIATLVTPNLSEAAVLTGLVVQDRPGMTAAARALLETGAGAVLVTGGHLESGSAVDVLATATGRWTLTAATVPGPPVHGTGCALSAAIAARLAYGDPLLDAVRRAKAWLTSGIETAAALGAGAHLLGAPAREVPVTVVAHPDGDDPS